MSEVTAETFRAALLCLGFSEVPSDYTVSGVEYVRGELIVCQSSEHQWVFGLGDEFDPVEGLSGVPIDNPLAVLGAILGGEDAPHR
jgi:hypothetical protein